MHLLKPLKRRKRRIRQSARKSCNPACTAAYSVLLTCVYSRLCFWEFGVAEGITVYWDSIWTAPEALANCVCDAVQTQFGSNRLTPTTCFYGSYLFGSRTNASNSRGTGLRRGRSAVVSMSRVRVCDKSD